MLTMPGINSIKFLRNDKSLSTNEIADIHKINWRTVKKYADGEQIQEEKVKEKYRRTNKILFECLQTYDIQISMSRKGNCFDNVCIGYHQERTYLQISLPYASWSYDGYRKVYRIL